VHRIPPGDHDDPVPLAEAVFFHPVNFPESSFQFVAIVGLAMRPSNRHAEEARWRPRGKLDIQGQPRVIQLAALLKDGLKVLRTSQPLLFKEEGHLSSESRLE
jgi:hypothetical protein